jgi:hypothetical protein
VQMVDDSTPVRWHRSEIDFFVDPSLAVGETSIKDPVTLIQQIAATWEAVDSHVPHFRVRAGSLGEPGYDEQLPDSENRSGVRLYRHDFPRERNRAVLALTLLTRNSVTGEVVDADIIIDAERTASLSLKARCPRIGRNVSKRAHARVRPCLARRGCRASGRDNVPVVAAGRDHKRDVADSDRTSTCSCMAGPDGIPSEVPPHVATILWCLLIVLIVAKPGGREGGLGTAFTRRRRPAHSHRRLPVGRHNDRARSWLLRSFWAAAHAPSPRCRRPGLTRVERLGRIGTLEQRVLDAPSGHDFKGLVPSTLRPSSHLARGLFL